MGYNGRREVSDIHPTNVRPVEEDPSLYIKLDPDYGNLLRWFIGAISTDSFDGHDGRKKAVRSVIEITRWLSHSDPQELKKILEELGND